MVQRAYAPPSPHLYNPRNLSKGKKTLFGCKSAPLEVKFPKEQQNKARSMEIGLEQKTDETPTHAPTKNRLLAVAGDEERDDSLSKNWGIFDVLNEVLIVVESLLILMHVCD